MYFGKLRKPEPSPPNPGFCTLKVALNEPDFESGSRKLIETKSNLKKEEEESKGTERESSNVTYRTTDVKRVGSYAIPTA